MAEDGRLEELQKAIDTLEAQGRYQELVPLAAEKLPLTARRFGESSREYAAALNEYGGIYRDIGRSAPAEEAFRKAAAILADTAGRRHPDYATTLNNLAGLYRLTGRFDLAESHYETALDIYRESLGEEHFLTVSAMNNLGLSYQDRRQPKRAAALHERCLSILRRQDRGDLALATTLHNLAAARQAAGDLAAAEPLLLEALERYRALLGPRHSLVAYGLNSLGAYYTAAGNLDAAANAYEQSRALCEALFGRESRNYAQVLINQAAVLRRREQWPACRALLTEAAAILHRLGGETDPLYVRAAQILRALPKGDGE